MATPLLSSDQASVTQLLDLAPVIENATVSKPIYEAGPVRLVLFAMDAGQKLSPHKAPMAAVVHVLEGQIEFEVEEKQHLLGTNGCVTMPPNAMHAVQAIEPARFLLTLIKEPSS